MLNAPAARRGAAGIDWPGSCRLPNVTSPRPRRGRRFGLREGRRVRILLGLLGLLSGLWPGAASALQPDKAFHHHLRQEWSIEAGLPQITVAALAQDPTGYL